MNFSVRGPTPHSPLQPVQEALQVSFESPGSVIFVLAVIISGNDFFIKRELLLPHFHVHRSVYIDVLDA